MRRRTRTPASPAEGPGVVPWHAAGLLSLLLLLHLAGACSAQALGGHWEGTERRGDAILPIAVDFSAEGPLRGSFTSGDLGAMDVPLAHVRVDGRRVY